MRDRPSSTAAARREALLVIAVCSVLFFTGLGEVPFYTRGEPREGLVVREMLRTGQWLVPSRPDGELARKPPLYYWLAASARTLLPGNDEWVLRLPSAALATAGVLAAWATARRTIGLGAGLPAALVLATSFEWTRAATQARIDMTLAAPLAGVLGLWMTILAGGLSTWRRRASLGAAVAGLGLAVLAKGPVGLVLPGLAVTAVATTRRTLGIFQRLQVVPTLVLAGILAGLWYAAAFAEHGWAFAEVVAKENWLRFLDTEDVGTGHGGKGIAYLLGVGLLGFLPWVPLLPLAFRWPRTAPLRLAAAWAIATVGFFALADAKRSVYLLPAYPAAALLVADGLVAPPASGWQLALLRACSALWAPALVALALAATAVAAGVLRDVAGVLPPGLTPRDAASAATIVNAVDDTRVVLLLLAAASALASLVLVRLRRRARWTAAVYLVAAVTTAWVAGFSAVVHPALGGAQSLRDFMRAVDRRVPADATLHACFPPDPGLRFYVPRPLRPIAAADPSSTRWLLLWENEHRQWWGADGAELPTLLASRARAGRRGRLLLVMAPPGPLVRRKPPPAGPASASGRPSPGPALAGGAK